MSTISTLHSTLNQKRSLKPKPVNPIETALQSWLITLPADLLASTKSNLDLVLSNSPKRWVIYPPMVLLPSGSFGTAWERDCQQLQHKNELWKLILQEIGKKEGKGILTHLAINSGIPLHKDLDQEQGNDSFEDGHLENILRTPSGLIMLYGDFGPKLSPDLSPTAQDFEAAFWVSTKQNGITQIWAPRYTMFSRGNIKEKARLLDFHKPGEFQSRKASRKHLESAMAVDLYAGIGYFVFSYSMMGMGRVVGWELNPWSVEGLRRGAIANGWSAKVVGPDEDLEVGEERIVVFLEDNGKAAERLSSVGGKMLRARATRHVNGGLLPTSAPVWRNALQIVETYGWLHLHENVGVNGIPQRTSEIEEIFRNWSDEARNAKVEHVELVKTFAPGVWHCVFDVYLSATNMKS